MNDTPDEATAVRCFSAREIATDPLVIALLKRCAFPEVPREGVQQLNCAVSGGADSTALLVLAVATGAHVTALHVDHGLREGSNNESQLVAELARSLGAEFVSLMAVVQPGGDLEARARAARLAALPEGALFGHTSDDQAETLLIRLMRGTGPAGLAGMRSEFHPLLGLRRSETESLCVRFGLQPFSDPSNNDPRFVRNRVRHEALPLLSQISDRDVTPLLCRLAELCAEQADLISALARSEDPCDAKVLASLPSALAAEVIRLWWSRSTGIVYPPDAAAIARILSVARGDSVSCEVGSGWRVMRTAGRLSLQHAAASETATVAADD
ncbi:MAG: tRNA lysidine(34) synthetase TilS [Actinomycetes bacterium]